MKVLAVTCHPDDMEVSCAGTLLACAARGDEVTVAHVANGNMGHMVIPADELRVMRAGEAQNAGNIGGFTVLSCDVGDLLVESSISQRDMVADVIRRVQPDFIITHSPTDYMPDHLAVSRLVFDASFTASVPAYKTGVLGAAPLTPIYYMDNLAGVNFQPTEYVDVSDFMEKKLEMLECHVSQMKWMRDHDGIDFSEFVTTCARFRGLQCGVRYAEAFSLCQAWPKLTTKRLLP